MSSQCSRCGARVVYYPNSGLCPGCTRSLLLYLLEEVHADPKYVSDIGLQQATMDAVEIIQDLRGSVASTDTQVIDNPD